MIKKIALKFRVLVITGTLFLFLDCAGKVRPWEIKDRYSLDVKILETSQWSKKANRDAVGLEKIMRNQLKYYIDNDMRIYNRLNLHYDSIKKSVNKIDTILVNLKNIIEEKPSNSSDWLEGGTKQNNNKKLKRFFKIESSKIEKTKKQYYVNLKMLNKGFKKVKKRIVLIENETKSYKNTYFNLKYKRSQLDSDFKRFNKKANTAFFKEPKTFYSKEIRNISKQLEVFNKRLDNYEYFLLNIINIASKEMGTSIYLTTENDKLEKYKIKFKDGYKEYLETLEELERIFSAI